MALVHHQQGVGREVIEQGRRRLAGLPTGQVAGVVFNASAIADLHHHLQVELGALLQPLHLHQLVGPAKGLQALGQLLLDGLHGVAHGLPASHIVGLGVDGDARHLPEDLPGEGVEDGNGFDLIVKQLHPDAFPLGFSRVHIDEIAAHPVGGAAQFHLVAGVLHLRQAPQQEALLHALAPVQVQDHLQVGLRVPQSVDGGHRGDDDGIRALQQGLGGGQAHLLYVFVDGGVFFYVGVGGRQVGLRLVVVVVGNKVLHRVAGEKFPHLAVELRRQGLVRRQHQGGTLQFFNEIGDGEGLAGTGHAQQRLVGDAVPRRVAQALYGLGLVPRGRKIRL